MIKNLMKKDEGGKEIIIEVCLAVIGVFLCYIFRTQIKELVETLVGDAKTKINNLFNGTTSM